MARSAAPCELTTSTVVDCAIQQCWNLYIDNTQMSQWAPAVESVECNVAVLDIDVIRKSIVAIDGKHGHTVELCTLFDPLKRIEFTVTEETFGFSHMLNSYGFSVSFDVDGEQTLLVMQTRYVPKKIFASLMSSKATQQQLQNLMADMLSGFKQYAEKKSLK